MRIDHKDKMGAQRAAVFAEVQAQLGWQGAQPVSGRFAHGDWTYRHHWRHDPDNPAPTAHQELRADGTAPSRAVDGSFEAPNDRWVFNDDASLSLWFYADPMPEYGLDEPSYTEERFHVLIRDADCFALFNGDGSIIKIYERRP